MTTNSQPRILVIRSGAIGDTLMATPLIRSLRNSFPDSYIGAVTSGPAADVLRYNPNVDDVYPIVLRHLPIWLSRAKRDILLAAARFRVDTVFSLESNSNFTALAMSTAADRVVTYDPLASGPRVTVVSEVEGEHSIARHNRAGESIGTTSTGTDMDLFYPPGADKAVAIKLASTGVRRDDRIVGIHAGWGRDRQDPIDTRLRSWPGKRFGQIAAWLRNEFGVKIVLTGTKRDRPLNDYIVRASGVDCYNSAGELSFTESSALIRRMAAYVTVDSGPAHMAAAIGTPLVTLWGPGIYTATRPLAETGRVKIVREPPPCAPCYGTPLLKTCRDNICMKQIEVDNVKAVIEDILR